MHSDATAARAGERTVTQIGSLVVGAVFLLVGVAGFIPGITTNYDDMTVIGHESEALLLGVFQVNVVHNLVHLAFGVAGIAAARAHIWSRNFLLVGGAIYLVLWVYGMAIDLQADANFAAFNDADNWLHLGLGVGMVALGLVLPRAGDRAPSGSFGHAGA